MKPRQKNRIVPRWEPEVRFAAPLRNNAPIARHAPEFWPENFYQVDEAWKFSAPLLWM